MYNLFKIIKTLSFYKNFLHWLYLLAHFVNNFIQYR